MKSILVLAFSDLHHDARVNRQINFLKDEYKITVASFGVSTIEGTKSISLKRIRPSLIEKILGSISLLCHWYDLAYKIIYNQNNYLKLLTHQSFDLIIANDIETVPLAFKLSKNSKVLFDAHEYAPRHFEDKFLWRLFFQGFNVFLCKKYLPQVDAMLTVGDELAKEYAKHFPVKPIVLTNANYYSTLKVKPTEANKIRLVHHGAANPSRQLELMIEAMANLDDIFTLDLILLTPATANRKTRQYLDQLKAMVNNNYRIKIVPPVKSNEVVNLIHQYDVGVFLIPPINFNYQNTLPNKLFDFIQARLAIVVGPTIEMANLVKAHNVGLVSPNFTPKSFGETLAQLSAEKIDYYKNNSNLASKSLSAEHNKVILNRVVRDLIE